MHQTSSLSQYIILIGQVNLHEQKSRGLGGVLNSCGGVFANGSCESNHFETYLPHCRCLTPQYFFHRYLASPNAD